jgi:hypothetical protein
LRGSSSGVVERPPTGSRATVRLTGYASVHLRDSATGLVVGGFRPGAAPNFLMTVHDGQPDRYALLVRRPDGSVYKQIGDPAGTPSLPAILRGNLVVGTWP